MCVIPFNQVSAISYEQFVANADSVKVGKDGDSQFYKNCCRKLWDDKDLCERSATGVQCPTQPNKPALPACTPKKKEYVNGMSVSLKLTVEIFYFFPSQSSIYWWLDLTSLNI